MSLRPGLFSILFLSLCLLFANGYGQKDITQWRGNSRDGKYPDTGLMSQWPADGPQQIARIKGIGKGWSSPLVYNKIIYTTGLKDTMDVLSAYDLKGNKLWERAYGRAWSGTYPDTRNTPSAENNRLFITSGMGEVACINAVNGDIIWKKNPHDQFKGAFSQWGMTESLLLTENAVITSVGGKDASVVALDKNNGSILWASPSVNDKRAYASPLLIEKNGIRIILTQLSEKLLAVNSENGNILWTFDLIKDLTSINDGNRRNNANTPLYKDGQIFITSGYNSDAVMLSLSENSQSVSLIWKNNLLDNHIGGAVEVNGFIYGSTWDSNSKGKWACLGWSDGKSMYEQEWHNKGPVIYADGYLYCMDEKSGNMGLVSPDPEGFKVISSFRVEGDSGPYWAHPIIYDRKLFVRHGDVLIIYDIGKKI